MSGSRPTTGSRATGELYVNFADRQIGYIDPSQAPVDLLPITIFMTASGYAAGAYVIYQGQLYQARAAVPAGTFNPAQWTTVGGSITVAASAPANPFQGQLWWDSVSGQLFVYYDDGNSQQWVVAINASGAYASPQWVLDTLAGRQNRNRIINGAFQIDQWNNNIVTTPIDSGFACDRWKIACNPAGKFTTTASVMSISPTPPSAGYFRALSLSAYSPAVTDYFNLYQIVEYINVADLRWGTAGAVPVTVSFWVTASIAGTYSGSICNASGSRSYPFTFVVPTADVWVFLSIAIPGDTSGVWSAASNDAGLMLRFDLGSGANWRAPANAWASGNFVGANGALSLVASNGAGLYFANVQLEVGTQATPFDRRSYGEELALCQRYYQNWGEYAFGGYTAADQVFFHSCLLPVPMRAAPTVGLGTPSYGNALALTNWGTNSYRLGLYATVATGGNGTATASPLTLSAEL